jgi:hypothetical protein
MKWLSVLAALATALLPIASASANDILLAPQPAAFTLKLKLGEAGPVRQFSQKQKTAQTACSPSLCRNADSDCAQGNESCNYCWAGTCGPKGR